MSLNQGGDRWDDPRNYVVNGEDYEEVSFERTRLRTRVTRLEEVAVGALLKIARAYPEETGAAAGRIARAALHALETP